jgi:AraC family transcriptional regulator
MSLSNRPVDVFREPDVDHHETDRAAARRPREHTFPIAETHRMADRAGNRLLADSRDLGWHDVYVSLTNETSWADTIAAVPHYCLAYCSRQSAAVTRGVSGDRTLRKVQLVPRLFGVVPADRTSTWTLIGSPNIQHVYLRRSMVDRVAHDVLGIDADRVELIPKLGFADGMLEQLAIALLDTARTDDAAGDGLYADHLARMLAVQLVRQHATLPTKVATIARSSRGVDRLNHVRDLIEAELDQDLSLERLAGEAGIGAHAFSAAFVRCFGVSPHRYVVERRIERAKRLLRDSDLPVATIAAHTGFANQSHLATVFKRTVGVTPRDYQRADVR